MLCACGCGRDAGIYISYNYKDGKSRKGMPKKFCRGHNPAVMARKKPEGHRKEKVKEYSRKFRKNNPEKSRASTQKWKEQNLSRVKTYQHAYLKSHPEKVQEQNRKRKARMRGAKGSFTTQQWLNLKESFGNICLCCKKPEAEILSLGLRLVPDHIVPLARGGSNELSNIQPLCHGFGGCNNRKSTKHIDFRDASNP